MKKGGTVNIHIALRVRVVLIMVAVFFQNRGNEPGQSIADMIFINIMRRKTKPKLVTKIRCRWENCKNILF